MGTPAFAVPSLDVLLRSHDVAAVYTRPDRVTGRGNRIVFSPVKQRALEAGVPLEQPASLRDAAVVERLARYAPDVIVVAAYGLILPRAVLDTPPRGCLNVHASLLPRWRGAAPVQRAILAGDGVTGVSIMRMEEGLDTGPYALQSTVPVGEMTTDALTAALARVGASALATVLETPPAALVWTAQDEAAVTCAEKVTAGDVGLDPSLTVGEILLRVRASTRSAPSRVRVADRLVVVQRASASDTPVPRGAALCGRELLLGASDGAVSIDELVPEGRSVMAGADWVRGARLDGSCSWGRA
jgi:methionyl-tRNA formyltransferase